VHLTGFKKKLGFFVGFFVSAERREGLAWANALPKVP